MDDTINIYPLLKWSISFIDAMLERGAIKGPELTDVATARQQLDLVTQLIEKQTNSLEESNQSNIETQD